MKISVVTINYNNSDGLRKSLESYFSQIGNNSELIVVDGESSDNSMDVISFYKSRIDMLVVEKDTGIFNAMNKGVNLSSGDFIYFLNSGEIFYSQDTLAFVQSKIIDPEKIYYFNIDFYFKKNRLKYSNDGGAWFVHQSCFVSSKLMKRYMFDEKFTIFGDLDLWARLRKDDLLKLQYIDETICRMTLDGIGSSPFSPKSKIKEKIYFAQKHSEYFKTIISILNITFTYLIALTFVEQFLFLKYYPFVNRIKNAL